MRSILAALFIAVAAHQATAAPVAIVTAENFYGEAARAVGGDRVAVESVAIPPGTDPHEYEPTPSVARAIADARVVIMNGADYDPWAARLAAASTSPDRIVLDVAALSGHKAGDNPHVWYDPAAMPALVKALAERLSAIDPDGKAAYEANRDAYLASLAPIAAQAAELRGRFAGVPVAATEPVFGCMADAIGLKMQNEAFQQAIMNETEPAARDVAAMEEAIRDAKVKVLFYNAQVEDAFTRNLADLARKSGVPLVAVTETMPEGKTFASWMKDTLDATAKALGKAAS